MTFALFKHSKHRHSLLQGHLECNAHFLTDKSKTELFCKVSYPEKGF